MSDAVKARVARLKSDPSLQAAFVKAKELRNKGPLQGGPAAGVAFLVWFLVIVTLIVDGTAGQGSIAGLAGVTDYTLLYWAIGVLGFVGVAVLARLSGTDISVGRADLMCGRVAEAVMPDILAREDLLWSGAECNLQSEFLAKGILRAANAEEPTRNYRRLNLNTTDPRRAQIYEYIGISGPGMASTAISYCLEDRSASWMLNKDYTGPSTEGRIFAFTLRNRFPGTLIGRTVNTGTSEMKDEMGGAMRFLVEQVEDHLGGTIMRFHGDLVNQADTAHAEVPASLEDMRFFSDRPDVASRVLNSSAGAAIEALAGTCFIRRDRTLAPLFIVLTGNTLYIVHMNGVEPFYRLHYGNKLSHLRNLAPGLRDDEDGVETAAAMTLVHVDAARALAARLDEANGRWGEAA